MNLRTLGRTGLKVSEIGLGCEGFIGKDENFTKEVFDYAISAGINCMDLYSPDPDMQKRVGLSLKGRRENFILQGHLCTNWENGQYEATRDILKIEASFEKMLKNLGTDYIDIGMIHYVDSPELWQQIEEGDILRYALWLKATGKIRHIGMSSHNPSAAKRAIESGFVDVIMFSINPCYDLLPGGDSCETLWAPESYKEHLLNLDPEREALYEMCQRLNIGITVMKAFGGGDLLNEYSPAKKPLTVPQCIHYCLTRPAVATVLAGAHSLEQLKACIAYETASAEEKDYAEAFASFPKMSWKGHCMYCGHCAPCPKGINIADVTKFLNLCRAQKTVPETVREHYKALSAHAEDCVSCKQCESRCPFEVPITQNMQAAKQTFGY